MLGWRSDHVTTVAADVQAGTETTARIVADDSARMAEVEVPAPAAGADDPTIGQCSVPFCQLLQARIAAMPRVNVQDHKPACQTGTQADVRIRPTQPPRFDLTEFRRRSLEAAGDTRVLGRRTAVRQTTRAPARQPSRCVAGKDRPAPARVHHG